jgi:hypothetical protein
MSQGGNDGAAGRRARRAWTAVAVGCGLAVVAAAAIPAYSWAIQQSSTTTWSAVHPVTAVDVTAGAGSLEVVPGADSRVSLTAKLSWDSAKPSVTETWNGDVLDIAVSCAAGSGLLSGHDCGTQLDLTVPAAAALSATSTSGDLSASRLGGPVNLRTESGGITLDSTSGPADVGSTSGGIEGSGLFDPSLTAGTRSGGVTLQFAEAPRSVAATTDSGGIVVLLPEDSRYRVEGRSGTGGWLVDPSLSAADAPGLVTANSQSGGVLVQYQAG